MMNRLDFFFFYFVEDSPFWHCSYCLYIVNTTVFFCLKLIHQRIICRITRKVQNELLNYVRSKITNLNDCSYTYIRIFFWTPRFHWFLWRPLVTPKKSSLTSESAQGRFACSVRLDQSSHTYIPRLIRGLVPRVIRNGVFVQDNRV